MAFSMQVHGLYKQEVHVGVVTHTSLLVVKTLFSRASGAVHFTGILPYRAREKL